MRGRLCFIKKKYDRNDFYFIQAFLKTRQFFVFKENSYDLFRLNNYLSKVTQLVVINEVDSNCSKNYSKLKCLNQCFKKNRLSKYIYNGNESGIIHLSYEPQGND